MARCLQVPCGFHEVLEEHGQHVKFIAELTSAMVRAVVRCTASAVHPIHPLSHSSRFRCSVPCLA